MVNFKDDDLLDFALCCLDCFRPSFLLPAGPAPPPDMTCISDLLPCIFLLCYSPLAHMQNLLVEFFYLLELPTPNMTRVVSVSKAMQLEESYLLLGKEEFLLLSFCFKGLVRALFEPDSGHSRLKN